MERIAFIINSLAGGGAERVMTTLLEYSTGYADQYDLHLILLDAETEVYAVPEFVTAHRLDCRKSLPRSILQLYKVLAALKPRIALSFLTRANLANVITAGFLGHKTIISERAFTSTHHKKNLAGQITKIAIAKLYPRATSVISVSQAISNDLIANFGVSPGRIVSIPNPTDSARIVGLSQAALSFSAPANYVIGMGRLTGSKNFKLLIDGFARSRYTGHLVIAGQGPDRAMLEQLAASLDIGERVSFAGFQENPFPLLRGADAYILPSNAEGFPNGLIEAMTLGKAVIATDCMSGPAEILDDRPSADIDVPYLAKYGILVPPNDVEAMQNALTMLCDPAFRLEQEQKALTGARRYDLKQTVAAYWSQIVLSHGNHKIPCTISSVECPD